MNEWERVEKERKFREQAEATVAFINMILNELEQAKEIIRELLKTQPPIENVYDIGKFDIDDYKDTIAKAEVFLDK